MDNIYIKVNDSAIEIQERKNTDDETFYVVFFLTAPDEKTFANVYFERTLKGALKVANNWVRSELEL